MKGAALSMLLTVSHAVLPDEGEDSFALYQEKNRACLCVADGCGGLGSKRYAALENRTGAYIAARLVADAAADWLKAHMPASPAEDAALCRALETELHTLLADFAREHCAEESRRIVGSMQRRLPATLCAAYTQEAEDECEACFLWCGDSRGYVLDADGLHQCTADHLRGAPDPLESLYRDVPLTRVLSADQKAEISLRRVKIRRPAVVIAATDGAFSSCLTPMEFEKLLIDTLLTAKSWRSWERKLNHLVGKMAQDDATLLLQVCGAESVEALQALMTPRRETLQKQFITPVRRHRQDLAYIRQRWRTYRESYDWTEGQPT